MTDDGKTLLLFDIDGTMVSCRGVGVRAMHQAVRDLFQRPPSAGRVDPQGKTDPLLFEEVGALYGLAPEAVNARAGDLHPRYLQALEAEIRSAGACLPKPGIATLLGDLAAREAVVLGLVSGNLEPAAWLKLRSAGLADYFGGGAFGSDGRRRADLVRLAMQRFAARTGAVFPPERVWVIGDTPDDVAGGRAHGARTLAVATGGFPRDALERTPADVVLDDLSDTRRVVDILCHGA